MITEDDLRRLPPDQLLAAFNAQCEQAASVVAAAYDNLVPGGSSCGGRLPPSGRGAGER